MRKIAVLLTVLILVGTIGGVSYTTIVKLDAAQDVKQVYLSAHPFPCELPEVVMHPATHTPIPNWMQVVMICLMKQLNGLW